MGYFYSRGRRFITARNQKGDSFGREGGGGDESRWSVDTFLISGSSADEVVPLDSFTAGRHCSQTGRTRITRTQGQGRHFPILGFRYVLTRRRQDWILDGFPRKASQAVLLDTLLANYGDELNFVVNLEVPDEVILERIEGQYNRFEAES